MNTDPAVEILLVEDNPHDGELILRAIGKRNLANHVVWVKDGAEALDLLLGADATAAQGIRLVPKVIFLDLKLPKLNGLEVLRRLKSDERTKFIPVVMFTSSCEERDIVQSYRLGVNSYFVKPVKFESFSEAVTQLGLYWLLLNQPPQPGCDPSR